MPSTWKELKIVFLHFLFDPYITMSPSSWKTTAFLSLMIILLFWPERALVLKQSSTAQREHKKLLQTITAEEDSQSFHEPAVCACRSHILNFDRGEQQWHTLQTRPTGSSRHYQYQMKWIRRGTTTRIKIVRLCQVYSIKIKYQYDQHNMLEDNLLEMSMLQPPVSSVWWQ